MKAINYILISAVLIGFPISTGCQGQTSKKQQEAPSSATIEHLSTASFKQKVFNYEVNKTWKFAGDKPCIIDFYADWCGPCRILAPTVEKVANDYKGKINVYKVNIDENPELANAFGISGIPAVLFCPKIDKPQMTTGVISKADFDKAIKEVLKVN
jgi:thioredoxin